MNLQTVITTETELSQETRTKATAPLPIVVVQRRRGDESRSPKRLSCGAGGISGPDNVGKGLCEERECPRPSQSSLPTTVPPEQSYYSSPTNSGLPSLPQTPFPTTTGAVALYIPQQPHSDPLTLSELPLCTEHEGPLEQSVCNAGCRGSHAQSPPYLPLTPPPGVPRKRERSSTPTHDWQFYEDDFDSNQWRDKVDQQLAGMDCDIDLSRPPSPAQDSPATTADDHEEVWWGDSNGHAEPVWGEANTAWPGLPYQKAWKVGADEEVPYWVDAKGVVLCEEPSDATKKHLRGTWASKDLELDVDEEVTRYMKKARI